MLTIEDRKNLIKLITKNDKLCTRERIIALMYEAGLESLLPQLNLDGPALVVVPGVLIFLENYGRVSFEHHALGRFLSVVKDYVGLEDKNFLEDLISRYNLMVPVVKVPETDRWEQPVTSHDYLEKIIGENTLRPLAYLEMALNAARSVAYIEVHHPQRSWWSGTGFLVSRGLLLTNHHVIPELALASQCIFRFNYQEDVWHNPAICKDYCARPGGIFRTNPELDYTLIELDGTPGDVWGCLKVLPRLPEIEQRVNIIQHPGGRPKQIAMQNNFVKYVNPKKLHYVTSTLPGSSGSPVFNDRWEVVGLHHAGGNLPEVEGGPIYYRNEGIAIGAILKDLPTELTQQFTLVTD
jgi:V8-like Glu-specific endopeptidase